MRARGFGSLLLAELRSAQLGLIWLALLLAATALSGVGFVAQRLQYGLQRDAAQLLGGQLLVQGDHALPAAFAAKARALGLRAAPGALFASMALGPGEQGRSQLVVVKAVAPQYPLLGHVRLRPVAPGAPLPTTPIPLPGTVWVSPQLAQRLDAPPQGPIVLGQRSLRIAALDVAEPDRGPGIPGLAPRVMMNSADLPSTGLIQPASRVTYTLALLGRAPDIAAYRAWAQQRIRDASLRGVRLLAPDAGGNGFDRNLRRGADYLRLVALLAAVLAGVAVAVAARDFARRRQLLVALLRALGLPRRGVLALLLAELAVLGGSAALLGSLAGLGLQALLLAQLRQLVSSSQLAAPGWQPVALSLGSMAALLLAFALPPLARLSAVPPLRVLRREAVAAAGGERGLQLFGLAVFALLLLGLGGRGRLGWLALGSFALAGLLLAGAAAAALPLLRRVGERGRGALALAARQLGTRGPAVVAQVTALGLALMALLLVGMLRQGLLAGWQESLPADAPDRFVINVQPQQGQAFRQALQQAGIERFDWYPMVRARLVGIDGRAVFARDYHDQRARRLIEREINLSSSPRLPPGNRIVAGSWQATAAAGAQGLSVEEGIARSLGIHLGDTLRFDIAGDTLSARVTSLRKVDWNSMHANFFVLAPPAMLQRQPYTWLAAFRQPAATRPGFDAELGRRFPDITIIDFGELLRQLRELLGQVGAAVQVLFGFALGAGLAVLAASLLIGRREREHETAVWRVLGASDRMLRRVMAAELLLSGLLAGLLGSAAAGSAAWLLARRVFDFHWLPAPWWLALGGAAGALLALAAGWLSLRRVLRTPALRLLRRAD